MLTPPATTFWIGSDHPFDLHEAYICFRSPHFDWDGEAATLWITADSRYSSGSTAHSWRAAGGVVGPAGRRSTAPTSALLHATGNVIAVQVYQPGYSHFSYVHRGPRRFWPG
ncbi:MAG: hypothetical protein R2851_26465 [Caldilineaceae bacterium]